MSALNLNCVLQLDITEKPASATLHRVVGLSKEADTIALLRMGTDRLQVEYLPLASVQERILAGEVLVLDHVHYCWTPATLGELDQAEREQINQKYSLIEPLLASLDSWIFDPARMHVEIRHRADELGLSRNQIVRPLYRCLAEGGGRLALASHYPASGSRGPQTSGAKRGCKRRRLLITGDIFHGGMPINDSLRDTFVYALRRYLVVRGSIKKVFQKLIDEKFILGWKTNRKGELKRDYVAAKLRPSLRQFRYFVDTYDHGISIARRLMGEKQFKLSGRGLIGKAIDGLFGPTARFEVDATVLDLYVVSSINRAWIIGRPVLYVVIDTFSRMVVGFHLTMEGPSWIEAQNALYNAFSSKVELCKRYGVEIAEEDWPCHHLAASLQVDRGEWRADAAESGANALGFSWSVPGPCRGDWKPVVERNFKIINDAVVHFLPGAHVKHDRERSGQRPKLDACLTLREVGAILIHSFLVRHCDKAPIECIPPAMVERDELDGCPLGIWKWGLQNSVGYVKQYSPAQVFTALLPEASATVCQDGIHWKKLRFLSARGTENDWWSRARTRGTWKVSIKFDKTDITGIWVLHDSDRTWEFCKLSESDQRFRGASLYEVEDYFAHVADSNEDRSLANAEKHANSRKVVEGIVTAAVTQMEKATEGMSNNERLESSVSMGDAARAAERLLHKAGNKESAVGKALRESDKKQDEKPPRTDRDPLLAAYDAVEGGAA